MFVVAVKGGQYRHLGPHPLEALRSVLRTRYSLTSPCLSPAGLLFLLTLSVTCATAHAGRKALSLPHSRRVQLFPLLSIS